MVKKSAPILSLSNIYELKIIGTHFFLLPNSATTTPSTHTIWIYFWVSSSSLSCFHSTTWFIRIFRRLCPFLATTPSTTSSRNHFGTTTTGCILQQQTQNYTYLSPWRLCLPVSKEHQDHSSFIQVRPYLSFITLVHGYLIGILTGKHSWCQKEYKRMNDAMFGHVTSCHSSRDCTTFMTLLYMSRLKYKKDSLLVPYVHGCLGAQLFMQDMVIQGGCSKWERDTECIGHFPQPGALGFIAFLSPLHGCYWNIFTYSTP